MSDDSAAEAGVIAEALAGDGCGRCEAGDGSSRAAAMSMASELAAALLHYAADRRSLRASLPPPLDADDIALQQRWRAALLSAFALLELAGARLDDDNNRNDMRFFHVIHEKLSAHFEWRRVPVSDIDDGDRFENQISAVIAQ
jgi:hypothetical protein